MKRAVLYVLIVLVLTGIFGLSLHQNNNSFIGSTMDIIGPAVAYADSDTVGAAKPPAPPPPID